MKNIFCCLQEIAPRHMFLLVQKITIVTTIQGTTARSSHYIHKTTANFSIPHLTKYQIFKGLFVWVENFSLVALG